MSSSPPTIDAIAITAFGGPEVLSTIRVPKPVPLPGEVLIRVRAFGLNHADVHMRRGEWDESHQIPGIECVGTVEECPDGSLPIGSAAAAVMGGLGRNRSGGYGEFVTVSTSNVALLPFPSGDATTATSSKTSWAQLAALPEAYCTAWSCLFTILDLQKGEKILIRGATSTIGQAALHLAVDAGAEVTASTRRDERFEMLRKMGAADVVRESGKLELGPNQPGRFDKTLNLIGNRALLESISLTWPGGRMLQAGWLGGLEPVRDFNPMLQMESGVHFSLFHSKVLGSPDFPLSGIPLGEIVRKIADGAWNADPAHVFEVDEIQEAHKLLDSGEAGGKTVVIRH